jgi:hypothetical protein
MTTGVRMELADILAGIVRPGHVLGPERLALRDPGWCRGSQGAGLLVRPADAADWRRCCARRPGCRWWRRAG